MKKSKISSILYDAPNWFRSWYIPATFDDLDDTDLMVIWGGEDIGTSIYGEKPYLRNSGYAPSRRDIIEMRFIDEAKKRNIPILGVCRGAQLVCAMDGGKLWQHVTSHAGGNHTINLKDGRKIKTNSLHHQMMIPRDGNELIGWADCRSPIKYNEQGAHEVETIEPEIVYFPDMKALGVQGHPEYLTRNHELCIETDRLLKERFNVGIF